MATQAHCSYCFEVLAASLESRQPLSLPQVEDLWDKYNSSEDDEDDPIGEVRLDDDGVDYDTGVIENIPPPPTDLPRPAAISRLLAYSPRSRSAASSPATGSSTPSSSRGSGSSSNVSQSSSRTSLSSTFRPTSQKLGARRSRARPAVEEAPLFVTWNTIRNGRKSLRGCIGTFHELALELGLKDYALTSAFNDTRFNPIASSELHNLECGVTLLTDFETASNTMDWELGKHGLRIDFSYHGRRLNATYLPHVAEEQGWTKEETVINLMYKAGWGGRKDDWRRVDVDVQRYQGRAVSLRYRDWREWRDWVDGIAVGR